MVEGDTEVEVLRAWWAASLTGLRYGQPDSLGLAVISVGGDKNFGIRVRALDDWGVPWVIVADGPVLSSGHACPLIEQLIGAGREPAAGAPADPSDFDAWRQYLALQGAFTLAAGFGEEIEAHLQRTDPTKWAEALSVFSKSKPRAAAWFAAHTSCTREADALYLATLKHLGLDQMDGASPSPGL